MGRWTRGWLGVVAVCALLGCGPTVAPPDEGEEAPPSAAGAPDGGPPPPPETPPVACTPTTCAEAGALCGSLPDGCGGVLQCGGPCAGGEVCGAGGGPNVCGRPPVVACAQVQLSARLPVDVGGRFDGDSTTATSGSCARAASAQLLAWTAPKDGTFVFDTAQSVEDTVLYVRREGCWGEELACDDDGLSQAGGSRVTLSLRSGETVVAVVGSRHFRSGPFRFHIREVGPEEGEACSDGADNDADGLVDCASPGCAPAPACAHAACSQYELGSTVPAQLAVSGAQDNHFVPSCASAPAPDFGFHFTAPHAGTFRVRLTPLEEGAPAAVLFVREGCAGPELACATGAEGHQVQLTLAAGQSVVLGVETRGAWRLSVEEG